MNRENSSRLDEQFVKELVEGQSAKLTSYAYHRTHQLEVARDIVQESFLKLINGKRQPRKEHAIAWLYTVCRNLTIDYLRKQSRWVMNSEDILEHYAVSSEIDPARTAINSETMDLVHEGIEKLPPRHREVMVLKFESGLSYKAIAGITKLSVSNVGFIIHQSVSRLRYEMTNAVK